MQAPSKESTAQAGVKHARWNTDGPPDGIGKIDLINCSRGSVIDKACISKWNNKTKRLPKHHKGLGEFVPSEI